MHSLRWRLTAPSPANASQLCAIPASDHGERIQLLMEKHLRTFQILGKST